jgi:hypothetical protein
MILRPSGAHGSPFTMGFLRNPLLPVGVLLVLLGLGNWYTGHGKTLEHEQLLASEGVPAAAQHFDEFQELDAHTNATLLGTLQSGSDASTIIRAKLDFYQVVQSGGRMLILLGLFCAAAGLIHSWYRQRHAGRDGAVPRGV